MSLGLAPGAARVSPARNAVYVSFIASGFAMASWAARIPQVRARLEVTPGVLGLILLSAAVGSAITIPLAGVVIARLGEARTVVATSLVAAAGLATIAVGYVHGVVPTVIGLVLFGGGSGAWDVGMNVQGAAVERAIGKSIMPRFHAGWSVGTVAGAAAGTGMVAAGVPVTADLLAVAVILALAVPAATRRYLPGAHTAHTAAAEPSSAAGTTAPAASPLKAWTEARTLMIGLFMLCVTLIEGAGNDWLSLGVIDGYHTPAVVGTATFALFLAAMTGGRWFGPALIDRYGRVPVLRTLALVALSGVLLIGLSGFLPAALAGAVLMGLGTSLGFPVGLSAAADDPRYAAGRVSTASSLGWLAFLSGPPLIGFIADHTGVLHALAFLGVLLIAALGLSRSTAPLR
jgi:MFS family permease